MAIKLFERFRAKDKIPSIVVSKLYIPKKETITQLETKSLSLEEAFKGEIEKKDIKFDEEVGEEHLFDMSVTEGLYKQFGFVTAVIDKYIDFIVGPGFHVTSKDENAAEIIKQFLEDNNFDTLLRAWIKEALIKGTGFIEISSDGDNINQMQVRDAKTMFIKRNIKGEIKGYSQLKGKFLRDKIPFEPKDISHLSINKVGNNVYGLGLIFTSIGLINDFLGNSKELNMLLRRKANSPYWFKVGDSKNGIEVSQGDIDALRSSLEFLENRHEWVTDDKVEIKVLDFGDIGGKFEFILNHDQQMMFYAFQIPSTLMGKEGVPEGLAKIQMQAFQRRIQSMQAEIEKVLEKDIFSKVLKNNKIPMDVHVEFEWGQPDNIEKNEKMAMLIEIMKLPNISMAFTERLEDELGQLVGFSEEELLSMEEERDKEEKIPQPIVPGALSQERLKYEKVTKYIKESTFKDYSLKEWLGFNYQKYIKEIQIFLDGYEFELLKARNTGEVKLGYLTQTQLIKTKNIFKESFNSGASIKEIQTRLVKEGGISDLISKDGKVRISKEIRANIVARTETVKIASEGSLLHYKDGKIEKVRWVASLSERTCPICEALNGLVYPIEEAAGLQPAHVSCRCAWIPSLEVA